MCSSLFHRNRYKKKNNLPLRYNELTETCHDLQKNFWTFINFLFSFLPSIDFSFYFVSMHGLKRDEIQSSTKGRRFSFFQQDFGESIAYRQGSNQLEKKSHASTSFHRDSCSFHQVRIDYSLILYNALSIFICFHLQNFYTICTSFFPCDSNLFPISLSFNIYIYIYKYFNWIMIFLSIVSCFYEIQRSKITIIVNLLSLYRRKYRGYKELLERSICFQD